jgi:hypothetical protein
MADLLSSPIEAENNAWNKDSSPTLVAIIIEMGVNELKALSELQAKGWKDEGMDNYFVQQRRTADTAGNMLERQWFGRMKGVLREVDQIVRCIQPAGAVQFLDLGCCPGGFTSYILDRNPSATGYGISLDVEKGGHAFLLENYHRRRFQLIFADLTYFQLGPSSISHDSLLKPVPSQIKPRSCDLVTLDGHQLRTQEGAKRWDYDRLLISQLILGFDAIKYGGTMVVKLSRPARECTAKLLYMLDLVCVSLSTYKPQTMHAIRGTFYAVAKEVGRGDEAVRLPAIVEGLRKLWFELTYGGENGSGRFLLDSDLDFVISRDELIDRYMARLIELGRGVWLTQAQALYGFLQRKGVPVDDVVL